METVWKRYDNKSKKEEIEELRKKHNLSFFQASILYNKGITDLDKFFDYSFENLNSPVELPDMDNICNYLEKAIKEKQEITIYGDYDVDGITATAIGVLGLKNHTKVNYYINDRFKLGYGLKEQGIDDIMTLYPNTKVILTVDNGITANSAVKYARDKGLIVLVTDHHEPNEELPDAHALVNPKINTFNGEFSSICGATVIWKVMMQLYWNMDLELDYIYDMVDIVSLATVCDVMPIINENRVIVKRGTELFTKKERKAFKHFLDYIQLNNFPEQTFGFSIGPMINSIGRLTGDCNRAVEIFLSEDDDEIKANIEYLIKLNDNRKLLTEEQTSLAESLINHEEPVIVAYHENLHEGLVGLIAGRLKEKYNKPTFILTKNEEGFIKGSARSLDEFSIKEVLDDLSEYLLGYGGHVKAGGLTLKKGELENFKIALNNLAKNKQLSDTKILMIDTVFKSKQINEDVLDELIELSPFGEEYPFPNIVVNMNWTEKRVLKNVHLKLTEGDLSILDWNRYKNNDTIEEELPNNVYCLGKPMASYYKNKLQISISCDMLKTFQKDA